MAYQVNFDPGLFMSTATKADQERIAPFKQGMATFTEGLGDFIKRRREKAAQRLFEEDVANRAQWKKLKDQLANPEYEEVEEEVKVPVEREVPATPTVLLNGENGENAGASPDAVPSLAAPGLSLLPESGDALAALAQRKQAQEPQFRTEKVKKRVKKEVQLPDNWEALDARYSRPMSEQYAELANQYRLLSPAAAAAMERRAEQERQIEAQRERDEAQSALRIQEAGGMPELLPLKAQQSELLRQIQHYGKMVEEAATNPMMFEFRDRYMAAKEEAERALAAVNGEIMRKMGFPESPVGEEAVETGRAADHAAQVAVFDIRSAMSNEEIDQILKNLPEGTSPALRSMLRKEADARRGTLRKLSADEVKAQKETVETVKQYFNGVDADAPRLRKQASEASGLFAKFSTPPKTYGEAKQRLDAVARVLQESIEASTGKSLTVEGVLSGVLGLNLGRGEITAESYNTAMETAAAMLSNAVQGHNQSVGKSLEAIIGTDAAPIQNPGEMNATARNFAGKLYVAVPKLSFAPYQGGTLLEGSRVESSKPKDKPKKTVKDEIAELQAESSR